MPITIREKNTSRGFKTGESAEETLLYILEGTSDDLTAEAYATAHTPASYKGLVRQSIDAEPQWVDTVTDTGCWDITVKYGVKPPPELGESSFSFDTTGGTQHITQSLQTIARYAPPGKTAPDFGGAIGVTHDSVEGVDIPLPVFNFSIRKRIPIDQWSAAYVGILHSLTPSVNNAPFSVTIHGDTYSFAAGECLFLGASGDESSASDFIEVTYKFAASPNKTGITIGDIIGIAKKGWHYLWVRYEDAEDSSAKTIVKKPVAAYVEKVIEEANLGLLGSV
ncbi:MAG: hypothetical protein HZA50_18310 [Planctomycetes bacterium]|nr:hypothetical protein [Planctomycetota bacterium]